MADLLAYERSLYDDGMTCLIGLDEAGRGPLAGPVVAAAVALKNSSFTIPVRDSKTLSARQRERAFIKILEQADVGVGVMNEQVIDDVNILQASFLAMDQAVRNLMTAVRRQDPVYRDSRKICLLVDGNAFRTELPYSYRTVVKGDSRCLSIACASIVAKVLRDRMLAVYHHAFPQYGFDKHKGYPTADHRRAILKHGPSLIHRRSFRFKAAS
ncbi:MAG: ribonuclease HII [Candidatus Omnitrophota bacterium]